MKQSTRRWSRILFLAWGILLVTNWFLLWSRFYWFGFRGATQKVFEILNCPLSKIYLWIEAKPNPWWKETFGTSFGFFLNDEFGPMLVLLLICLFQAAMIILLFSGFQRLWRNNRRSMTERHA